MLKKKSLGQHFLRDQRILEKIVAAANLELDDSVLEIGPGEGTLTALLLKQAGKVIAVEKDSRLIPLLQEKFVSEIASGKLILVPADILTFKVGPFFQKGSTFQSYKVVANLPYYITGAFLKKFLGEKIQPTAMTLLVQKEVAERIVAKNGRENILSISVKCYGTPRIVGTVKAGSFSPSPKVDSAIFTIENISKKIFAEGKVQPFRGERLNLSEISEANFFALLKRGFAHPRKLLSSNLNMAPETLAEYGIAPTARAENLRVEQWGNLIFDLNRSRE